jgi:hypothetical protein
MRVLAALKHCLEAFTVSNDDRKDGQHVKKKSNTKINRSKKM